MEVQVLGVDHLAIAAVDLLKGDGVWGIPLQQALHLQYAAFHISAKQPKRG